MIEMYASDSLTTIRPLDNESLVDIARIYNCNKETRFATGLKDSLSIQELSSLLERTIASKNEFLCGIYVKSSGSRDEAKMQFIGLCAGLVKAGAIWIKQLFILPEYRGKGIGARAVGNILRRAVQSLGASDAYLSVVDKNRAGLCFWMKLGFCEEQRLEKLLFDENIPVSVIIMHKRLT